MPGETKFPEIKTELIEGVPFFFISRAIADQIKKEAGDNCLNRSATRNRTFFTIMVKSSENSLLRRRIADR